MEKCDYLHDFAQTQNQWVSFLHRTHTSSTLKYQYARTVYFMMVALPTRTHTPFLPKMKFRDHFLFKKAVIESGMFIISS